MSLQTKLVPQEMSDKATDTQELGNTLNQLMENKASISDQGVEQQVIDVFTKFQANSNELREFVGQINEEINSEGLRTQKFWCPVTLT